MKPDYTKIKFEDLEFKNTLNENEIDPAEKEKVDGLIEQLKDAVEAAVNYWRYGKK
jgi:hypothetical protein